MSPVNEFTFQVEFAVLMKCDKCRMKIQDELDKFNNCIRIDEININEQRLLLSLNETSPSSFEIQNLLENKLKLNTIIRGTGNFFAAVCEIYGGSSLLNKIFGVARFIQNESKQCLIDIVIDGLNNNNNNEIETYNIGIHEYGDLSDSNEFKSIGLEVFNIFKNIKSINGKLSIKKKIDNIDISTKIGQSLAITKIINNSEIIIAAGVIARASKILKNTKKICACSGQTLWQEHDSKKI